MMDLDNTLYDYKIAENAAEGVIKASFNEKFGIKESDFDEFFKESKIDVKAKLENSASSHSRLLYIQNFFEKIGLGSKISLFLEFEQLYWLSFMENMKLYDHVVDFLEELRLSDIKCNIVTDLTTSIQIRKLMYLNLTEFFCNITTSEEVRLDKPDPEIFFKSKEKVDPKLKNIWMIGDSYEKDIVGAKQSLNATTILFTRKNDAKDKEVDASFSNYNDLTKLIKKLI